MIERNTKHRFIPRNHSNALPRYIIAFDAETTPKVNDNDYTKRTHHFRLGVAIVGRLQNDKITGRKVYYIQTENQFWEVVADYSGPRHTVWIVSHNALFDMVAVGFPDKFSNGEYVIDWPRHKRTKEDNNEDNPHAVGLAVLESPPTIIAVRNVKTQGRVVIVDTLNWFPVPLREMGDACGIQKQEMPHFHANDNAWFDYCYTDTQIVFETFVNLIKWVRDNDMGMFRYTGPAQAMAAFRHRFMSENIYTHENMDVKKIERDAYFGGRTEVFRLGPFTERIYQLDVNSLFPAIMRDGLFPCVLDRYELRTEYLPDNPGFDPRNTVAEVILDTKQAFFPVRRDKRILFPTGRFRAVLCGAELDYATKRGLVAGIRSWSEYRTANLFTLWVDTLWKLRQGYRKDGQKLYERFTKSLLNGLYGKFGQLAPKWVNCPATLANLPWTTWTVYNELDDKSISYRSVGWLVQKLTDKEELEGTFPAISAFVTAAARMRMNSLREIAGRRNVYYQGVDGLIVTQDGYDKLTASGEVSDNELGKLRLQMSVDDGEIFGCADYRLGDKVVISGRAKIVEDHANAVIMQRKFSATNQLFTKGPEAKVEEFHVPWSRSGCYSKGNVHSDGWIEPLELSEVSDFFERVRNGEVYAET